jgi:hypothetical protein
MSKPKRSNGKRLYQCDECKARRYVHWVELNRSGKPRCNGCGSTRLEMCSNEAHEEMQIRQERRLQGEGGSLVMGATRSRTIAI